MEKTKNQSQSNFWPNVDCSLRSFVKDSGTEDYLIFIFFSMFSSSLTARCHLIISRDEMKLRHTLHPVCRFHQLRKQRLLEQTYEHTSKLTNIRANLRAYEQTYEQPYEQST